MKAFAVLLLLFLHPLLAQNSDWSYRNPYPQNDFYKIKFFNQNTGYIAGAGGYIFKTTNGGASFQYLTTGTTAVIYDMHFLSQQIFFAVGENSTIIYTSNGGNSWVNIFQVSNSPALKSIKFLDPLTGFVVGNNGRILKTTNGGFNWNVMTPLTHLNLNYISFQNGTGWMCADSGWIYKTTNGGSSWESDSLSWRNNNCIYFVDAFTGFLGTGAGAVGSGINLYKTTDAGNSWQETGPYMTARNWYSILFINQNTGFVTGQDAPVLVTTNGGQFWNIYGVQPNATMNSISVVDTSVYICGTNGWISRMNFQGTQTMLGGTKNNFASISFLNENTGMAIGGYQVLSTFNSGVNWKIQWVGTLSWSEGHSEYPTNVFYENPGTVYLKLHYQPAGWHPSDELIKSTNNGKNWIGCFYSYGPTLIEGFDEINGVEYISAISGAKFIFRNSGSGWDTCFYSTTVFPGEISFANSNTGLAVINNSNMPRGFLKTTNGGNNWETVTTGNNKKIEGLKLLVTGTGYIAGDSGFFMKTTNFGTNWQLINSGINTYFNSLRFVDDDNGWLLYSSGNWPYAYRLYFTKNGGLNFYPITSLGSFNVKAFSFIDANTGFVAGDSGVVLKTTNGGLTFINQTGELYPDNFSLSQNYPNPFNPVTNIRFDIPKSGYVKIIIYDLLGREITQLVNQQMQLGSYSVDWDASNYPSGVYFYSIEVGNYKETRKMILIK